MRFDFKKVGKEKTSEAGIQILILIISTFAFAYLFYSAFQPVSAQTDIVQCCEKTKEGNVCQEFLIEDIEDNCEGIIFPGQCKDLSDCKLGCCYDAERGICTANSPKKTCNLDGGKWVDDAACNNPECKLGCCVLGTNTLWTTEKNCQIESGFFGLQADFRQEISSELECIFFAERDDEGACVLGKEAKTCKFTTRDGCKNSGGNFYENIFCSDSGLDTECLPHDHPGCLEGKDSVYWFDSCGNREEIKEECSVFDGTICGLKGEDYGCKSINCNIEGKIRKNGESWCVYDGTIGNGKDPAGSRHMKHTCFMGEEILEPCADFRNEICVQSDIELDNGEVFSEAACRINRWRECIEINLEENPEKKKERCEEIVDCEYKQVSVDSYFSFPVCTPHYPPGFDLKNRPDDAKIVCGQATQKCTAVKVKKLTGWEWVANEDCTKMEFTEKMNEYCISLGDCGGYVNYVGEYDQGFSVKGAPNSLSSTIINKYKSYARPNPNQEPAEPGNFSGIISTTATGDDGFESGRTTTGTIIGSIIGGVGGYGVFAGLGDFLFERLYIGTGPYSWAQADQFTFLEQNPTGGAAFGNAVASGIGAAAGTYVAMKLLGGDMPADAALVISIVSSIGGTIAGMSAAAGIEGGAFGSFSGFGTAFATAFVWAVIIAAVIIGVMKLFGIGKTKKYIIEYHCLPWQAPVGGKDCNKCNGDIFKPCSDYRCSSLGQTCELINKGTGQELCINNPPTDISSPRISPLYGEITEGYEYSNVKDTGFELIEFGGKCIPEFTTVSFGIETDKPAQCKIGDSSLQTYDDMPEFFGGDNLYLINHTTILNIPNPKAFGNQYNLTDKEIEDLGEINYYVKCKSVNGNVNEAAYTIRSCVKPGPDLTAPRITNTIPRNGAYVGYNQTEQDLTVWTNEPASCSWSNQNRDYELMENNFKCQTDFEDYGLYGWPCNTTLTNLENIFYIKCQDVSENKNTMTESYVYKLIKSESELTITEIKPDSGKEIVSGIEPVTLHLEVLTSGGAENGKAECSYKFREEDVYIKFLDTFSVSHKQVFNRIIRGNYKIYIKCQDAAGNIAETSTEFSVKVDTSAPKITRVYYDGNLKIITNEPAVCAYSFTDTKCQFDIENITIAEQISGQGKEHSTDWQTDSTYYIKCKDIYENQPGRCSIIVKPYDII